MLHSSRLLQAVPVQAAAQLGAPLLLQRCHRDRLLQVHQQEQEGLLLPQRQEAACLMWAVGRDFTPRRHPV